MGIETIQEKKKWLQSYRAMEREVRRIQEEMELWRERAAQITQAYSGQPGSGGGNADTIPKCVAKIMELEQQLDTQIDKMVDQRKEIERAIAAIESRELGHLLRLRYIDGKTWENVAADMNYTYRWVLRLHSKALKALHLPRL